MDDLTRTALIYDTMEHRNLPSEERLISAKYLLAEASQSIGEVGWISRHEENPDLLKAELPAKDSLTYALRIAGELSEGEKVSMNQIRCLAEIYNQRVSTNRRFNGRSDFIHRIHFYERVSSEESFLGTPETKLQIRDTLDLRGEK